MQSKATNRIFHMKKQVQTLKTLKNPKKIPKKTVPPPPKKRGKTLIHFKPHNKKIQDPSRFGAAKSSSLLGSFQDPSSSVALRRLKCVRFCRTFLATCVSWRFLICFSFFSCYDDVALMTCRSVIGYFFRFFLEN